VRRAGGLWPQIAAFDALVAAAWRASRGKRTSAAAARFLERVEPECLALERELSDGSWRPSRATRFEILDPKPRTITAVPFRDQVVHHALIAALEPVFERRMIADSFACRRGKGTHAALRRARQFVRCHRYFLKLDVKSFFDSVRHDVAVETIARCMKDRRVVDLCRTILRGAPEEPDTGVGLSIGALTSQWFANLLLDRLDHFAKERLRVPGYVRYMDVFVLFDDDRDRLHAQHDEVRRFLAEHLCMRLKDKATILAPVSEGLPFLGWLVFRGTTRLRPENKRRYAWRLRYRHWQFVTGLRTEGSYLQAVASVHEHMRHGRTLGLRRAWSAKEAPDI
jgi:hypothetical protein